MTSKQEDLYNAYNYIKRRTKFPKSSTPTSIFIPLTAALEEEEFLWTTCTNTVTTGRPPQIYGQQSAGLPNTYPKNNSLHPWKMGSLMISNLS